MKTLLIITIVVLSINTTFAEERISLKDATNQSLVSVQIRGGALEDNTYADIFGAHTGRCVTLEIKNLTDRKLDLKLENGRFLSPDDGTTQRMVVTEELLVSVDARKTQSRPLYAMCSQLSNSSPNGNDLFSLGSMASEDLLGLTQLIEKWDQQNSTGQSAVWSITDNNSMENIQGDNEKAVAALRDYVATHTDQKPSKKYLPMSSSGEFTFMLFTKTVCSVVLYNSSGEEVIKMVDEKPLERGGYSFTFEVETYATEPGIYTVKLFKDGKFEMYKQFRLE